MCGEREKVSILRKRAHGERELNGFLRGLEPLPPLVLPSSSLLGRLVLGSSWSPVSLLVLSSSAASSL